MHQTVSSAAGHHAKRGNYAIYNNRAELMRGEPVWPGKTDFDQLCMIKNSLGPLTPSQTHTLITQGLYDQVSD